MTHLTKETFRSKVFDFQTKKSWDFAGEKPCIVDFYANWCGPCKMLSPVLEEISKEYNDKIDIYKVDTEDQQELASLFGVVSIPSILFVPKIGQPVMSTGFLPKNSFQKAIKDILKVE